MYEHNKISKALAKYASDENDLFIDSFARTYLVTNNGYLRLALKPHMEETIEINEILKTLKFNADLQPQLMNVNITHHEASITHPPYTVIELALRENN